MTDDKRMNEKAVNIPLTLGRTDVLALVAMLRRAAEGQFPGLDRGMAREANDLASLLLFAVEDADAKQTDLSRGTAVNKPSIWDGTWSCPVCQAGMEGCGC